MEFVFPHDYGNILEYNPIATMLAKDTETIPQYNAAFLIQRKRSH